MKMKKRHVKARGSKLKARRVAKASYERVQHRPAPRVRKPSVETPDDDPITYTPGKIAIDAEKTADQMGRLAEAYEDVMRQQAIYNDKAERAKSAKKKLDSAKDLLLKLVGEFTHKAPLPLFDQVEAESDHERMLDAIEEMNQTTLQEVHREEPEPVDA
jgi:hypothetical protein